MSALSKFLEIESKSIYECSKRIDSQEVEKTLDTLVRCYDNKSKIIISGVGKSGIVARKIAATFSSIGLMGIYLNPLDALHGDLGVICKSDVGILISNSGETQELLDILPYLKKKCSYLISISGKPNSTLGNLSDSFLNASVDREVCPLNLAPTASTSVALAIGDSLAAVFMERKGISYDDFAINHPSGSLGKRLTLTVNDLMIDSNKFTSISPDTKLTDLILTITKNNIGCCCVLESKKLVGFITDGDLRRALINENPSHWENLTAKNIMTIDPITINSGELAFDALKKMNQNNKNKKIGQMPVIVASKNSSVIIGIIKLKDLIESGI